MIWQVCHVHEKDMKCGQSAAVCEAWTQGQALRVCMLRVVTSTDKALGDVMTDERDNHM